MPFLGLHGCDLYYEVAGEGPTLVFAHGAGGNHLSWWQQVPHFRNRYTCVTYSARGCAPSTGVTDATQLVDDLAALIDHLETTKVTLVGHSLGSWTCLGYTLRAPQWVAALVMGAATGLLHIPEGMEIMRGARPERTVSGVNPAGGLRMAGEQPALHYLLNAISILSRTGRAVDGQDGRGRSPDIQAQLFAVATRPKEEVASLQVPVLCIVGQEDGIGSSEVQINLVGQLVPTWHLVTVPEAGHSVYSERAGVFN